MTVITLHYQTGSLIFRMADWLCENGHGSYSRNDKLATLNGPGWKLYHATQNNQFVTKAEFDNDNIAAMFALRWR